MEMIIEILSDALIDTLKLVPFLFLTYLALEALEHKAGEKSQAAISKAGTAGPAIGAVLGVFPQCGFSAAAATFYAGRVITLGTLIAVFLSTSDEMLPIFIAEAVDIQIILQILGLKLLLGMVTGFVIDLILRITHRQKPLEMHARDPLAHGHDGSDDEDGIFKSALKHTVQVTVAIFIITLILGALFALIGEEALTDFMSAYPGLSVFASALVGLIPNCAASVAITQLYLEGILSFGATMAGLLTAAGVGLLVLFRTNKHLKENLLIVALLFVVGSGWGLLLDVLNVTVH